jgi:uncharacterized repeat protein (TIGR01451 family)
MTVAPSTATAGGQLTYELTVTNGGAAPAQNVVVTDKLSSALTVISCAATGGTACVDAPGRLSATFPVIPPGASETITITALVNCGTPDGTPIVNPATAVSATADPNPGNNSAAAAATAANPPPTLTGVAASRTNLFPPLHHLVPVTINYVAADTCGPVTTTLRVTSDEPVTGPLREQGPPA